MRRILQRDEPEAVYRELVDGLADDLVPPLVLAVLLLASGAFVLSVVPDGFVLLATGCGVLAALVRACVILHCQRRRAATRAGPLAGVRRQERLHGASIVALSVTFSLFSLSVLLLSQGTLNLLPLCIGFGLSGGLISRVSIRPRIAAAALLALGLPGAIIMAQFETPAHLVAAVFIAVFTISGLQTIAFIHETARRGVALRLQVEAQARRDPLTGLLNRFGLGEAVSALPDDGGRPIAVLAFDLDGFKRINDQFGHAAGDRLLEGVAERIRAVVPAGTIAARTGGDEFVLVQVGVRGEAETRGLAERLHGELTRPCDLGGCTVTVGLSIGYDVAPLRAAGFEALVRRADEASYTAKREGGGIRWSRDQRAPILEALA